MERGREVERDIGREEQKEGGREGEKRWFMMVCLQYLFITSVKFCTFVQKYQTLVPANNSLLKVYDPGAMMR